jgi:hypothetical protein
MENNSTKGECDGNAIQIVLMFQRKKENIAIFGDTGGWQKEMSIVKKEEEMRKGKNDEQKGMA